MHVEDVVRESGLRPRYVEEWLRGMTCAKYLEYDPVGETYRLPDEHAFLLASDDTDHFMGGLFSIVPVLLRVAPDVATAFAQGGGVRFEEFGSEGVVGLDLINRGQYEQRLTRARFGRSESAGFPGAFGWEILSTLIRLWETEQCLEPTLLIFGVG